MVRRDYTSHVNPEGLSPSDRAERRGIMTTVGENIASNPNITDANLRLVRSPLHFENILRSFWTRVGLGLAQYPSSGVFKIVQLFSSRDFAKEPLKKNELSVIKDQVIQGIKDNNPNIISEDVNLSKQLQTWQDSFYSQMSVNSFLRSKGFQNFALRNLNVPFTPETTQKITERKIFMDSSRTKVGVSSKLGANEMLEIFVAFI